MKIITEAELLFFYSLPGDDLVGVPPDFATNSSAPSPQPTLFDGDDAVSVNENNHSTQPPIDRPELEDDYSITNQSVPVFIPILDNDVIPSDSTGKMGVAMHGEIDASENGIVYTPADHFCGFEKFEYSVTDSTDQFTDTAQVTIEVICVDNPTPLPVEDTLPPSPSPSLFTGDDAVGVPPNFNEAQPDIDRPELNDDYATTNQGEAVIIPVLANDTIPAGKFCFCQFDRILLPSDTELTIVDGSQILQEVSPSLNTETSQFSLEMMFFTHLTKNSAEPIHSLTPLKTL